MISLKNLEEATAQAVFDQIVSHLRAQGEPCRDDLCVCWYRKGGKSCAAGCLISDEEYKKEYESKGWYSLIREFRITEQHKDLIYEMQVIHDSLSTDKWEKSFSGAAERFSLIYAPA